MIFRAYYSYKVKELSLAAIREMCCSVGKDSNLSKSCGFFSFQRFKMTPKERLWFWRVKFEPSLAEKIPTLGHLSHKMILNNFRKVGNNFDKFHKITCLLLIFAINTIIWNVKVPKILIFLLIYQPLKLKKKSHKW